jgi:hypothetical protein
MKLSHALLALSVCSGLIFAEASTEAAKTEPAKTAVKPAAGAKVGGKVVSVDAIGNTIIVKTGKKEDTIGVTTDTKILSGGKAVALADIKADEKVRMTCKKEDGKLVATEIKVVPVAPAKKSEATPPAATPAAK